MLEEVPRQGRGGGGAFVGGGDDLVREKAGDVAGRVDVRDAGSRFGVDLDIALVVQGHAECPGEGDVRLGALFAEEVIKLDLLAAGQNDRFKVARLPGAGGRDLAGDAADS